jgi:hypothetical protein
VDRVFGRMWEKARVDIARGNATYM